MGYEGVCVWDFMGEGRRDLVAGLGSGVRLCTADNCRLNFKFLTFVMLVMEIFCCQ